MDSRAIHRLVLKALLSLVGESLVRVRLVSRLADPDLLGGDSARTTYFFLPDFHLMTSSGERHYQYAFRRRNPNTWLRRDILLDRLCGSMLQVWNSLPTGQSLKTVQLGDLVDLWREAEIGNESADATASRILDENPVVRTRLLRKGQSSLEADVIVGNHDLDMRRNPELAGAFRAAAYGTGAKKTILVTHGDLFDGIERLVAAKIKEKLVERFGPDAGPGIHGLDRTQDPMSDGNIGAPIDPTRHGISTHEGTSPVVIGRLDDDATLPDVVNVWRVETPSRGFDPARAWNLRERAHSLLHSAVSFATGVREGTKKYLTPLELEQSLPDLSTIVVGHSHRARICIYKDNADTDQRFVLLDCGAWIEEARFADATVPSCQIGVLSGGDFRIYQLDPVDSLHE